MPLTRVTPLDGDSIIPLAQATQQCRVTHSEEDGAIRRYRDAAIGHVERVSGVALATSDWLWTLRSFKPRIDLPIGPVTALVEVSYFDSDGIAQTYDDARLIDGAIYPAVSACWPSAYDHVSIAFSAGLTTAAEAPELVEAALLLLGHFYANREAVNVGNIVTDLPLGVQALIDTYPSLRV